MVDFYQVAMQMEQEGRNFYLDLQQKAVNPKLKRLFGAMADEELGHYEVFRKMSVNAPVVESAPDYVSAEGVFSEMLASGLNFSGEEELISAYRKAQELEDNTAAYYKQCLANTQRAADKVVLLKLYYEEKKHSLFLEHLIELISDPLCYVDSAEWDRMPTEEV